MSKPRLDPIALVHHALRDGIQLRRALEADAPAIASCAGIVAACLKAGGKVLLFGNGGSAADAQHIAAELVGRYVMERAPLPAIALTVDTSALTAIANDYGYEQVFERQVRAFARPGDVAIAITTSGKSPSILRAVRAAKELGMKVIGLTGAAGRAFADECDAAVLVPTKETARIQELHITVGHLICALVDAELYDAPAPPVPTRDGKRVTLDDLVPYREWLRTHGRVVVTTNGCFDILHAGHVASLRAARAHGDVLVVAVNDDAHVRRTKGEGRPIHDLSQRVAMLSALDVVDFVLPFSEATPNALLARLKPDVHCKGQDYAGPDAPPMPEADVVRGYGGRIEFLPFVDGLSSSSIARRLAT